jgi:hypothetical protein
MKRKIFYVATTISLSLLLACNNSNSKNESDKADANPGAYTGPPYTIQLVEYVNSALPDLHSYTHATYQDKIIMFGGRTNGLHADSYNFNRAHTNDTIFVVDTKDWNNDISNWQVYKAAADDITSLNGINNDQFHANNAEFFTNDNVLYVIGGLLGANVPTQLKKKKDFNSKIELLKGTKPSNGSVATNPQTLPYMTAIDLPSLINSVMKNQTMAAGSIRQIPDSVFAITGGELSVINNTVYLVFGWSFPSEMYTHKVQSFTYTDDGKNLTVKHNPICSTCADTYADSSSNSTGGNYRRRDGSLSAMVDPATEQQSLLYYSGVFKNGNTNFTSPVWINTDSVSDDSNFVMLSNVYTCQVVPVYSKSKKIAYATLLGGMRNAKYTGGPITKPTLMTYTGNYANTSLTPPDENNFTSIPFSNQLTTIAVNEQHNYAQYLLPDSFPDTKVAYTLPYIPGHDTVKPIPAVTVPSGSLFYNGAESEMYLTLNKNFMLNGAIDYDVFASKYPTGNTIGYLHGGILSYLSNVFGPNAIHYSIASNRIFAIKLVPIIK